MKEKLPIPSKNIINNMDKGIIWVRVGNCEHAKGKQLMCDIPVIVNGLETSINKNKLLTSDIIHSHGSDKIVETSIKNKNEPFKKKLMYSAVNISKNK
jgi:hypothetical protein